MPNRDARGRFLKKEKETTGTLEDLRCNNASLFISAKSFRYNLSIDISNYKNIEFKVNGHKYVLDNAKLEKLIKSVSTLRDEKGRFVKRS